MITAADKLACIEREIRLRRRNYPRWVAEGKMTQQLAERELNTMESIREDYRVLAEKERLI